MTVQKCHLDTLQTITNMKFGPPQVTYNQYVPGVIWPFGVGLISSVDPSTTDLEKNSWIAQVNFKLKFHILNKKFNTPINLHID